LLGAQGIERFARPLLEQGRRWVGEMLSVHPRLENHVDARYEKAQRWLGRLGFTLDEPEPYGAEGLPFRRFTAEASSWAH
jgi:hypothetical protein